MKSVCVFLLLFVCLKQVNAQKALTKIDATQFFKEESVMQVTIGVDLRHLLVTKMKQGLTFPAIIVTKTEDNVEIREPVTLEVRGNFRKSYCYVPPLRIHFKSEAAPVLSSLGTLKLVNTCKLTKEGYEYLLKEFLVYKIYNLLTDKSLRVRLLRLNFVDSAGKRKPIEEFGFLIEDVKEMARRNSCAEREQNIAHTELTDRKQMTLVALFEYMIGNLDWAVPMRHNIKLIVPKEDSNVAAFPVPYDFDYSGLVKTDYAVPPMELMLDDVTIRNYRGFPRTMPELQAVADHFLLQKASIYKLINEFDLLPVSTRNGMLTYLDGFFNIITKPNQLKVQFIDNARKN